MPLGQNHGGSDHVSTNIFTSVLGNTKVETNINVAGKGSVMQSIML